jgi:predicted metal-binding protein
VSGPAATPRVCLQICVAYGAGDGNAGRRLYDALSAAAADLPDIAMAPVDCLAVCDRPVTLAFQALGKWSYIVGGAGEVDLADILAAARAVAASPHGIPAMDDRPSFFRSGVIARVPPLPERVPTLGLPKRLGTD